MFQKGLFFFLFINLSLGTVFSQGFNKTKLDSLFDALAINDKAMGSVAVSKNGKVVYSRAIGYKGINEKEKLMSDVETKYRVGSISKMFTSTLVFQLIEQGKMSLTTTLDQYFPQVPNAKIITISNLLNHRSGLHNFTDEPDYVTWMTSPKTKEEMLAVMCKYKVDFEPNAKFSYSNANYVLLGYIIEKVCKKTYAEVLKDRIVDKIGLKNTYVGAKINIAYNECNSYLYASTWELHLETDMTVPGGAGFIVSTPSELTTFITALFAGNLVTKNSLLYMKTMTDGYGMGLIAIPFYAKQGFGHTGGIDGFRSVVVYFTEDSVAVSYCGNGEHMSRNDILVGVLSIYYDKPYVIPSFKSIVLSEKELDVYVGVYASAQMPLVITITKQQAVLMAQATGQSAFPLEVKGIDVFGFVPAGIIMEFNPSKNELVLKQAGQRFLFAKQK